MEIKEDILQFIWQIIKGTPIPLFTTDGLEISVLETGFLNRYQGPDFKEAKLKIGEQLWAGNIEVHVESKDWNRHQHQLDENYQNVILHVVYYHNEDILLNDNTKIPVLELKSIISETQLEVYRSLMYNQLQIPCQEMLPKVSPIHLTMMLQRACIERYEQKTNKMGVKLLGLESDWNTLFYHELASNFGFKTNAKPFLALAESLPLSVLSKHKDDLNAILALCFGQAGMLGKRGEDEYSTQLFNEYQFLKKKYNLSPSLNMDWKFTKTRPANFPTLRIAQFANLIHNSSHLFSKILTVEKIPELIQLFQTKGDEYWQLHYQFGKKRKSKSSTAMGLESKYILIINTVCQTLFAYGHQLNESVYKERALEILQHLPAERNSISNKFKKMGFSITDAAESQGAIGLLKLFCHQKACMDCQIGKKLMVL